MNQPPPIHFNTAQQLRQIEQQSQTRVVIFYYIPQGQSKVYRVIVKYTNYKDIPYKVIQHFATIAYTNPAIRRSLQTGWKDGPGLKDDIYKVKYFIGDNAEEEALDTLQRYPQIKPVKSRYKVVDEIYIVE